MRLETFEDVCEYVLPMAKTLSEDDVKDLLLTVHNDPTAGPDILEAYRAASVENDPSVWSDIWDALQKAAAVANIISSIGGAAVVL
jgi:hypothetical protein